MLQKISKQKVIFFCFAVTLMAVGLYIRLEHYSLHEILGREDGVYEYIQFFVLLISSILFFRLFIKNPRSKNSFMKFFFLILALTFFVVSMEEISWGQRLLGFETPYHLNLINVQDETNIHNISFIHNSVRYIYIMILVWSLSGLLIKFLFGLYQRKFKPTKMVTDLVHHFLILPRYLIVYFLPLAINLLPFDNFAPQDFELAETFMCLGLLIHTYNFYRYWISNVTQSL